LSDDGIKIARNVFNNATWNLISYDKMTQKKNTAANEILLLLSENKIREEIKLRSKEETDKIQK